MSAGPGQFLQGSLCTSILMRALTGDFAGSRAACE